MSCYHGEKPDCHSDHHCQGHQGHSSGSHEYSAPGGGNVLGTLEKLDEIQGIQ